MRIAYTPAQAQLRDDVRGYYAELLDDETLEELHRDPTGPTMRSLVKQMGADQWLGVGWPTEFGGQGFGPIEQYIFFDESMRAAAPLPITGLNTVGPALMQHGDAEQKQRFIPGILSGDLYFSIGYSEPEAGTDLASLRTTALRDGDEYVIQGQKMWTSHSSVADYCWLAARTDPEATRHRGLSIFLVPMDAPGVTRSPLRIIDDHDNAAVYYDEVRVPATNRIGAENDGWTLITSQLNHERVTMGGPGACGGALEQVRTWAAATRLPDGRRVLDQEWVQRNLARAFAGLRCLQLMNWRAVWGASVGDVPIADVSAIKVFSTELYQQVIDLLLEVVGEPGYLKHGSPGAVLAARLELMHRYYTILTFGGGANEVQREIIGARAFGFPRGS